MALHKAVLHDEPPFMYQKLLYDTERDFVPVSLLSKAGSAFVVRERLGIRTLADLTSYIKANPTKLSVANIQPGSLVHLAFETYLRTFGGKVELIPYKTSAQVLQDLWGGQVDLYPGPLAQRDSSRGTAGTRHRDQHDWATSVSGGGSDNGRAGYPDLWFPRMVRNLRLKENTSDYRGANEPGGQRSRCKQGNTGRK